MSHAFIYHYWNDRDKVPVHQDMRNPVVVSIATARVHHPDVPIYVLDVSDEPNDWRDYPETLRFSVVHQTPSIPVGFVEDKQTHIGIPYDTGLKLNYSTFKYCSSTFDVVGLGDRIPQRYIEFVDSDLFFLKPNLPMPGDRFNCRRGFVGFYYYDKYSRNCRRFLDLWKRSIFRAMHDHDYRKRVMAYYRTPNFMNQESAFIYLCTMKGIDRYVRFLPPVEHEFEVDRSHQPLTMFHFTGFNYGAERGRAAFMIREYFEPMRALLGNRRIRDIFGLPSVWGGEFGMHERHLLLHNQLRIQNIYPTVARKRAAEGRIFS